MKIPISGNAEEIKGANYPFFSVLTGCLSPQQSETGCDSDIYRDALRFRLTGSYLPSNKMIIDPVCAFVDNSKYFFHRHQLKTSLNKIIH
jgi:hypothetical protein